LTAKLKDKFNIVEEYYFVVIILFELRLYATTKIQLKAGKGNGYEHLGTIHVNHNINK